MRTVLRVLLGIACLCAEALRFGRDDPWRCLRLRRSSLPMRMLAAMLLPRLDAHPVFAGGLVFRDRVFCNLLRVYGSDGGWIGNFFFLYLMMVPW